MNHGSIHSFLSTSIKKSPFPSKNVMSTAAISPLLLPIASLADDGTLADGGVFDTGNLIGGVVLLVTSVAIYLLGKDLMMLQEELKEGYDRGAVGGSDIRGEEDKLEPPGDDA